MSHDLTKISWANSNKYSFESEMNKNNNVNNERNEGINRYPKSALNMKRNDG